MMPSCDRIGVPIHFHSSTTSGSASLMSFRILLRVSPRQAPSSAILFEMSFDADWPWVAPDFFMFLSYHLAGRDNLEACRRIIPVGATMPLAVQGCTLALRARRTPRAGR